MTGTIFDIKEFAVFDGPGIRTTVFMKGCPLRCKWCHNPEGLSPKPEIMISKAACTRCGACVKACPKLADALEMAYMAAYRTAHTMMAPARPNDCNLCGKCIAACHRGFRKIAGTVMDSEKLAERLIKDKDVYEMSEGGVTFSGGEPFLQWKFVSEVLKKLKTAGVHTAIETSGFTSDENFREAMGLLDLVMMDWKVSDPMLHKKYTGVDQETIRKHAEMLVSGTTPFILRMPIIPGVNDNREHFEAVAQLVKGAQALVRVDILPYQPAAGAKYEMVGLKYAPEVQEEKTPEIFTDVFDAAGIPYQKFK